MRRIAILNSFLVLFAAALVSAQEPNCVNTKTFYQESDTAVSTEVTTYSDGLARELQSRIELGTNRGLVVGRTYDDAGRLSQTTIPFMNDSAGFLPGDVISEAAADRGSEPEASTYCYSEVRYKDGPLDRVERAGGPGLNYSIGVGHSSRIWYCATAPDAATGKIDANGFVTDDSLDLARLYSLESSPEHPRPTHYLAITKDPDDKYSQEIKDVFGRTVATCTMEGIRATYTYDLLGNLLKETPPHPTSNRAVDDSMARKYRYNTLGHRVWKMTPDGDSISYKHDRMGRLVYAQNGRQRYILLEPSNYFVYLYDNLGRNYAVGISNGSTAVGYAQADPLADTVLGPDELTEINPRIRTIYDNAQEILSVLPIAQTTLDSFALQNVKGRTVAHIAYDESDLSDAANPFIWQHVAVDIYSYNDEGLIAARYKRIPRMNTFCKTDYEYDLQGNVVQERFFDRFGAVTPKWRRKYEYDYLGRLTRIRNTFDSTIAQYAYDNYGRLSQKHFKKGEANTIDTIQYSYNVRDWITEIRSKSAPSTFVEITKYATAGIPHYNGNAGSDSLIQRITSDSARHQRNVYTYDNVNRLVGVASNITAYNESIDYQQNGRIDTKSKGGSATTYHYYPGKNRLNRVTGSPGNNGGNSYVYDPNGNMVLDCSKNMVIEYDWRDMPVAFRFYSKIPDEVRSAAWNPYSWETQIGDHGGTLLSEVKMTYDASGARVLKVSANK